MSAECISAEIKTRLKDLGDRLDPLRLLDEIRAMQHHLAALAKGERMHKLCPSSSAKVDRWYDGLVR
jgi:hypothetical protein